MLMFRKVILGFAIGLVCQASAHAGNNNNVSDLEILESYVEDFTRDPYLTEASSFGVEVGETMYAVDLEPGEQDSGARGVVRPGAPEAPTFYFTFQSSEYLKKLERGEFNALTLMGKAFSSDVTPMDVEFMEGFEPNEEFGAKIIPFIFHFWTRGTPELVSFGPEKTRVIHGTNMGVFYYQPGLRSAWFDIRPGQHVNEDERSRANEFPSMFILIEGEVKALIGGEVLTFTQGSMMFVPAGVSHQFINEGEVPAFGFLFMFGEGA